MKKNIEEFQKNEDFVPETGLYLPRQGPCPFGPALAALPHLNQHDSLLKIVRAKADGSCVLPVRNRR